MGQINLVVDKARSRNLLLIVVYANRLVVVKDYSIVFSLSLFGVLHLSNLDLINLLGLPKEIQCTHCKSFLPSYFEDHNLQHSTIVESGKWLITRRCLECDKEFDYCFNVKIEVVL